MRIKLSPLFHIFMCAFCLLSLNWSLFAPLHRDHNDVNIFNGYSNPSTVPVGGKNRRMVRGGGRVM